MVVAMAAERPVTATPAPKPVGRPRHHSAETERALILDAAYRALSSGTRSSVTIADILEAAGLSTRSFYRHFESKDELLCEMYLRDAQRAGERINSKLAKAVTVREAVATWIDEIMNFTVVKARAERAAVIGSALVEGVEGSAEVSRRARDLLTAPLCDAIARGVADGSFSSRASSTDGMMIAAVVFDAAGLSALHRVSTVLDRQAVHSFCFRALGADAP
jgi:AcrR family transcriptional regulator